MIVEKEFSNTIIREVAPIGAALTPGLIPFWSPKWKRLAAISKSPCRANASAPDSPND
jgi:hypothetical protein